MKCDFPEQDYFQFSDYEIPKTFDSPENFYRNRFLSLFELGCKSTL